MLLHSAIVRKKQRALLARFARMFVAVLLQRFRRYENFVAFVASLFESWYLFFHVMMLIVSEHLLLQFYFRAADFAVESIFLVPLRDMLRFLLARRRLMLHQIIHTSKLLATSVAGVHLPNIIVRLRVIFEMIFPVEASQTDSAQMLLPYLRRFIVVMCLHEKLESIFSAKKYILR